MKLPKLYAPVMVRFGSLTWCLGSNGGVMEVDTITTRKARRVINRWGEWSWQLVLTPWELKHERGYCNNDVDQESINSDRDDVEIIR